MSVDTLVPAEAAFVRPQPQPDFVTAVGLSTAAFLRHNGNERPENLGSGTFVKYGNLFGVVTCAHAWHAVHASAKVGVMAFTVRGGTPQFYELDGRSLDAVYFGEPKARREDWKGDEPDLAFVRLPPHSEDHFQALATVRNLQRQEALLRSETFVGCRRFLVGGVVDAMTEESEPKAGRRTRHLKGYVGLGPARRLPPRPDGHDQCLFSPKQLPMTPRPTDYEGTSGGGLWMVQVVEGGLVVALAGVVHFQTLKRRLVCHGPESLYGKLAPAMRQKWPEDCP